ncbi:phosphotransferase [Lederbergia sp. NSJ-179]|uniref:phosphotransferase n=1 Tax=Lederbergia sp. NSJ-179 TaxID=2931402 RepID=UPI001FCFDD60|nr:phosphotransferase [Lederbergia sp. NSJ-179]MCJ7842504.1 phosphotransferase [Lederbergia sp. NSJ-179]
MEMKVELVKQLIREQFPQWKELHIKPVKNGGHDNRTFHLGETMTVRLPSGKEYEPQVKKEARWLNLLVQNGHLSGVIDFGILGVGDPACDFAMAWTFFDRTSRQVFKKQMDVDEGTWNRAKGWALWKALITYHHDEKKMREHAQATIKEILADEDDRE